MIFVDNNNNNGGGGVYTGTSERSIGGIADGQVFIDQSMTQMWDALIKQEKFPTLVSPSSTFTSSITGFREIGEIIASITFNSSFNRGSILPQYTATSPFRSGVPNEYQFTGVGLVNQAKIDMSDNQVITNYIVLINGQSWQGRVDYDAGVQPKSSYDVDFNSPLASGITGYITRTITGVYPFLATTVDLLTMTKQPLTAHNSVYVQVTMVAETSGVKQTIDFPIDWSAITGIQFYNTVSSTWEWINGSKVNSLLTFTSTTTTHDVQGSTINYNRLTHNGATIGSRQLRFYTN